jgi:hypothetical protein
VRNETIGRNEANGRYLLTKEDAARILKQLSAPIFQDMHGPALQKNVLAALDEAEHCRVTTIVPRGVKAVVNYDGPFMVAENILDLVLDLPDVAQDVIDFLIATRRIR